MSSSKGNCSVIGAGVIGLMSAWFLSARGWKVTVYDRAQAFSGSSWAGAGIISPMPPWGYPPAVQSLVEHSLQLYPALLGQFESESGIDPEYLASGVLYLGPFDQDSQQWREENPGEIEVGCLSDWLPSEQKQTSWYFKDTMQLRNPRLGQSLLKACIKQGVRVIQDAAVEQILLADDQLSGLLLSNGEQHLCTQVVLAAGAWSDHILSQSGLPPLGVRPLRGQILLWKGEPGLLTHMMYNNGCYLIPRQDGHILGGSTVEDVGFDLRTTSLAEQNIKAGCVAMFPALAELPLVEHWSGLRPYIEGEIPVVGKQQSVEGLWIHTGHYRNGLGMAPASAHLLADLMTGQTPLLDPKPYQISQARPNN